MTPNKIYQRNELAAILQQLRTDGKVVVTTNGCFDVLHLGHLRYLQVARQQGDVLVVGVNSDSSVRELKGESRPLIPDVERAEMLGGLECVDYVVIFPELTPIELLAELKPNIHVKGGDYKLEQLMSLRKTEAKLSLDLTYRVNQQRILLKLYVNVMGVLDTLLLR